MNIRLIIIKLKIMKLFKKKVKQYQDPNQKRFYFQ